MRYQEYVRATSKVIAQYSFALTVRQIFYRLFSAGFFENTTNSYKRLDKMLTKARERGDIDAESIVDRSREIIGGDYGYHSIDDFVKSNIEELKDLEQYTRRLWDDQPRYVEIWVEKDALATLVSNIADGFRVVTYPSRGYSSYTMVNDAIKRFYRYQERPITVLHFADHDPSGVNMTEEIQSRFYRYGCYANVRRIALTYEQVKEFGLAPMPTKLQDSRWRKYSIKYGSECWELDALPPDELQRLVRESIKEYIDVAAWNKKMRLIEQEKKLLEKRFSSMEVISLLARLESLLCGRSKRKKAV